MCWPTCFDKHLCERIIDSDNNLSAPGRMSIMAKKECWRVRCILYSSERCSLTLFPTLPPPEAGTTSVNVLFKSKPTEKQWGLLKARHGTARVRDCLGAKSWPVMWLGVHWFTFHLNIFFFFFAWLNRQIKNKMFRSSFIYLNRPFNKFYSPCVFLFRLI